MSKLDLRYDLAVLVQNWKTCFKLDISFSEIKTLTTELNVERLNKIMINEKIEELRKVLPHDLREATKKRHYSLGKGA